VDPRRTLADAATRLRAEDEGPTQSLSFATGWFDCNRKQDEAFETRLEYRVGRARRPLRGVAVATLTDDSSLFVGAGVGYEIGLGRRWAVTPVFVPGYYRKGNGKDLGYSLEFRSQIELGYTLAGGSRVTIAFSHLSNGGLGSCNPGEESLTIGVEPWTEADARAWWAARAAEHAPQTGTPPTACELLQASSAVTPLKPARIEARLTEGRS
jgi:lipid A 3-O-deacylase